MDCRLDESTEESSAENALSSVNDIAATNKSGKPQINKQGNENGADGIMGDSKTVIPNPELNNSEKVSCKEEDSRGKSEKLMNCKRNEVNLAEENPSGSRTMDESDNSDFVVEDVKVCDICGDAGREDLLATCCRCSDGAEHTYCMREMLEKVPEGDWMCEDCRYDEEIKNQRQRKVSENGKSSSPGKASGGNSNACLKLDTRSGNDHDMSSKDRSNVKILGKRPKEDVEVSSLSKIQAVESIIGSPKTSGSSIVPSLSQGRNLGRAKEKLTHRPSSGAPVGSDDTESPRAFVTSPRRLTSHGTFLKSNSFGSLSAKPKVKHADEAVPSKQKSVREPPLLDIKEGIGKSYGKSMSFRTTSSGRYGNGESKVKMLSPKFSYNQDNKGFKHTKERSVLERKSSVKLERPVISSPRVSSSISNSKNEKKQGCLDETALSSTSNNYQPRAVQCDSKASSLSKIPTLTSRRASSNHVFTGDGKRQSSVTSDLSGAEQEASNKEEPFLSGSAGKRSYNDPNGCSIDESTQPKDSVSYDETLRENGNHSIQNTGIGGSNEVCEKCRGVGHLAQRCPGDGLPDIPTSKSLREVTNGSNDLKAAIEAALLRKPGICRKSKVVDQSNDSSQSSKIGDIVSQDHLVDPVSKKNVYSGLAKDVVTDARNSTNACRHASLDDVETSTSRTGDGGLVLYDKKTSIRDSPFQLPSPISVFWRTSAIPEPEFTWQGNFEVRKNDKVESCDGIQAHLSAYASPKVLSVVNKFSHKVVLDEVPRLSVWPLQFQEHGVKEDNVALYFFAKDVNSYEKSYNLLLKNMIKNDLALKGIIDGVELMIFPSTQLPQQSQRWNLLYFLWGVFRAKKTSHFYQACSFPGKNLPRQDNYPATTSLSETMCSLEPVENNLISDTSLVSEMAVSKDGYDVSGVPSLVQVKETDTINVETNSSILGSDALTSLQRSSEKEGHADLNCMPEAGEVQPSVQAFFRYASSSSECMPGQHDAFRIPSKTASSHALAGCGMSNKWITGTDHVSHSTTIPDGAKREEAPLVRVSVTTEQTRKDLSSTQLNDLTCKRPQDDGKIISEAALATSSQPIQIDDDEDDDVIVLGTRKRQKIASDGSNGSNDQSSSSNDEFSMRVHDIASGPSIIVSGKTIGEKMNSSEWGNAERFFFPVDPATVEHLGAADKSLPGKTHSLDNQIRVESPNLDLALGGETGLSEPGIPSFLIDKKVVKDGRPEKHPRGEEEDISGSLSLSLSFPFPDTEEERTSISRAGQLAERPQVSPPFLLFGGIGDK